MSASSLEWEKSTIQKMIFLYCRKKHNSPKDSLCPDCKMLYEYSLQRIDKCPFGEEKPRCSQCTVHCYKRSEREKVREVMRYSGPRMIWRFPGPSLRYFYLKLRKFIQKEKHLSFGKT